MKLDKPNSTYFQLHSTSRHCEKNLERCLPAHSAVLLSSLCAGVIFWVVCYRTRFNVMLQCNENKHQVLLRPIYR